MTDQPTTKDNATHPPFPAVIEAPVSWGAQAKHAEGFKALVNPDTGQVFSIVSKDYRLIRHEEAVSRLEDVIQKSSGLGRFEVERSLYNEGPGSGRHTALLSMPLKSTPATW